MNLSAQNAFCVTERREMYNLISETSGNVVFVHTRVHLFVRQSGGSLQQRADAWAEEVNTTRRLAGQDDNVSSEKSFYELLTELFQQTWNLILFDFK